MLTETWSCEGGEGGGGRVCVCVCVCVCVRERVLILVTHGSPSGHSHMLNTVTTLRENYNTNYSLEDWCSPAVSSAPP